MPSVISNPSHIFLTVDNDIFLLPESIILYIVDGVIPQILANSLYVNPRSLQSCSIRFAVASFTFIVNLQMIDFI